MKIIKTIEDTDGQGSKILRPVESFPSDTIYTIMVDDEYICYQTGDELPENVVIPKFFKFS